MMCAVSTPALSITWAMNVARLLSDHSKRAGTLERPKPGKSGRITRNSCAIRGIQPYQTVLDSSLP
jgi:hypothetical protein